MTSTATARRAGLAPGHAPADPGAVGSRWVRGAGVATLVAVASYAGVALDLLTGPPAVLLLGVLLVAVPSSPLLARRLALNVSLLIGVTAVIWSTVWPVRVDHAALLVAVASACVAWRVCSVADLRDGVRAVVPDRTRSDLLVLVAAVLATAVVWRWAVARSPRLALEALAPGVDNASHFGMFATVLTQGAPTTSLGVSPDGSPWAFGEYPQGFHCLVATVTELVYPASIRGQDLLVAYTQSVAIVVVLGLVLLTAAIVSLSFLTRRLGAALPVVTLAWAAFLWHPGQALLTAGFANFWLAGACSASALLLSLSSTPRLHVPTVAAVGALLVAVAFAWMPLLVLAGPAAVALYLPLRRTLSDGELRHRVWWSLAVLVVSGLCVAQALLVLVHHVSVSFLVTATGGISSTSAAQALVLLLTALVVCPLAPTLVARRTGTSDAVQAAARVRFLTLASLAATVILGLLLVAQMRALGNTSYYFLKLFMGLELILAGFVPAVVALVLVGGLPYLHVSSRRWSLPVVAVGATLVASQFFGIFPRLPVPLWDSHEPGTASLAAPYSSARLANGLLIATASQEDHRRFLTDYLAIGAEGAPLAFHADNWFHTILLTESTRAFARSRELAVKVDDVDMASRVARGYLGDHPGVQLLVSPRYVAPLRRRLAASGLDARVVTWGVPVAARPASIR